MKICSKCKAEKPLTEFHKDSRSSDLVYSQCKHCISIRNAVRYAADAEKNRARSAEYKRLNPDASKKSAAKWRSENQERIAVYKREWRVANIERARSSCAKWREINKDMVIASNRSRKSALIGSLGTHSHQDVLSILAAQRARCANCLESLEMKGRNKYHVDHIMPLSRGGSNDKLNLQCLCPTCNMRKHAKDPIFWAQQNGRLL